ncbi:Ribonuclease H-like superfamily [Sesbania bispinosa]|nr:Ribonuclease H-like superfamily [Sesbania bispinosa]
MMMKLGWGLVNTLDAYWVHVIRSKCQCGDGLIRRSLADPRNPWVIGDGRMARFWEDRWLHLGLLLHELCLVPFLDIWSTTLVSDFVDPQYGWKLDLLSALLPPDVAAEIVVHLCPCPKLGYNYVVWGGTPNGEFSTKSAYNLFDNSSNEFPDSIWQWDRHQRTKCLIWMILNKGLKTCSKCFRRGFIDTDVCAFSLNHEETPIHIHRDCVKVREVWNRLGNISLNSNSLWRLIFGLGVWAIWKGRNALIFKDSAFCVNNIASLVQSYVLAERVDWVLSVNQKPKYRESLVGWSFPNLGWVKADVDGSFLQNLAHAGCGGIFRGADGKWLIGFTFNLGRSNVLLAEFRAIETALRIAWENE